MKALRKISDQTFVTFMQSYLMVTPEEGGDPVLAPDLSDYEVYDLAIDESNREAFLDAYVRPERDRLLEASDKIWIEQESKGEDTTALDTYRQSLRDFPADVDLGTLDYTDEIVFPILGGE